MSRTAREIAEGASLADRIGRRNARRARTEHREEEIPLAVSARGSETPVIDDDDVRTLPDLDGWNIPEWR